MKNKPSQSSLSSLKKIVGKSSLKNIFYRKTSKYKTHINDSDLTIDGTVGYNEYGGYFVPLSSLQRPAVQNILNGQVYEPQTIKFMRNHCQDGDVIHAGTFFGDFLPGLSSALSDDSKIWAFEPSVENYKCAQITCIINQLSNVQLHNAGLGNVNQKSKLLVESEDGLSLGGGSRISNQDTKGKYIEIEVVKIDDIVPQDRKVSILQLDVEGYEKQALEGAEKTILNNKPIIILEDNNNIVETDWFRDNILSLGYKKSKEIHDNTVFQIDA